MKKILIGYITKDLGSGINQYLINFVKKISKKEIEIDLLVREDEKYKEKIENEILQSIDYNKLYFIPNNKKPIKVIKELNKIMNNKKYDAVYFNISSAHDNLGLIVAKMNKIKRIIVHSHSSNASGKGIIKTFKKIINKVGKIVLANTANIFLACSNKAAKWLLPSYIYETNNYETIYNCVDKEKYQYNEKVRNKIRNKLKIDKNYLIGNIARFNIPTKNNIFIIDIFNEIIKKDSNARLICIGDGPDSDIVKTYADNLGLLDKIIFTGRINNVEDYIQAIDTFILPSKFEGLPITGIEAQFANIPCIFSDTITNEVIIGENSKQLSIKDPKIWADEILKLKNKRNNKLLEKSKYFDLNENKQAIEIVNNETKIDNKELKKSCLFFSIKIILMIHYILNLTSYLNGFNYLTIIVGILMIALLFLNINKLKEFLNNKTYLLLLMFILSYVLSIIFNYVYDLKTSIKVLIWLVTNMFFTNSFMYLANENQLKNELKKIITLLVILVGICNVLNIIQLISKTTGTIKSFDGQLIVTGISSWGRFYGVFYDPNYASVICTIAFISGIYLISKYRSIILKVIIIINNIMSYTYICFCQSRSGLMTFAIGLTAFCVLYFVNNNKNKIIRLITIIMCVSMITLLVPNSILNFYNNAKTIEHENNTITNTDVDIKKEEQTNKDNKRIIDKIIDTSKDLENENQEKQNDNKEEKTPTINRKDNSKDISNRRFDIWKSGIEIFKISPIYGVGYGNVESFAKNRLPETYVVNNSFSNFRVFHNFIIDIIVNQGIVGLIIITILGIKIIIDIIKYKILSNKANNQEIALILASLTSICVSGMFLSQIFYVNNAVTFMFWLMFGYLNYYIRRKTNEK